MASTSGPHELARLESFLRDISKHEQRASRESAEQMSIRAQQRRLKDQLQQAHEEIAAAHESKAKLCETIGSLQQTNGERESELKQLKSELQASRELHTALTKKLQRLEDEAQDMKRGYIKSLACRMKSATHLLSQLQSASVYPRTEDVMVTAEVASRCGEWIGVEPSKRKRVLADQPTDAAQEVEKTAKKVMATPDEAESVVDAAMEAVDGNDSRSPSAVGTAPIDTASECTTSSPRSEPRACADCTTLKSDFELERTQLDEQVADAHKTAEALRAKHDQVAAELARCSSENEAAEARMRERDDRISELQEQLADAESKLQALIDAPPAAVSSSGGSDQAALEDRIKELEDNLTQMNAYADHLEIVIGQCPSCSVKVQTESTQDIESKAA